MSKQIENITFDDSDAQALEILEEKPEVYPLRDPSEDPRWAVRIIWTWVSIAIFLLLFFVVLLILGIWYD
ncbi:MAG: hypothetical protein FVQ85_01005 [Planctomycetes bacterium]|nr:hypothetical protein [Planctomycetota bacterium]